jgi:hypothetical protein
MKKALKSIISPFYYLFVDQYAFDNSVPLGIRLLVTLRHTLAAKGFFINENEKKFAALKDVHKGERCFIIGNGPSLNNLDLTHLKNEYTFGVNAIYLNYEKMQFHPTYYVVEDNLVAEDRKDEINAYDEPKVKFFGNYFRNTLKADDKTIFINLLRNYSDVKNFPYFSDNAVRKLGVGGSVTYVCLQLAYHMGFEKVYMIGFDHNYKIPNSVLISNRRGTGFDITSTEDDVNHFSKEYFGKGYRWHDPNVERMEVGFRKANEFYNLSGRKVYNATLGGKLEAFDRINYSSLF